MSVLALRAKISDFLLLRDLDKSAKERAIHATSRWLAAYPKEGKYRSILPYYASLNEDRIPWDEERAKDVARARGDNYHDIGGSHALYGLACGNEGKNVAVVYENRTFRPGDGDRIPIHSFDLLFDVRVSGGTFARLEMCRGMCVMNMKRDGDGFVLTGITYDNPLFCKDADFTDFKVMTDGNVVHYSRGLISAWARLEMDVICPGYLYSHTPVGDLRIEMGIPFLFPAGEVVWP